MRHSNLKNILLVFLVALILIGGFLLFNSSVVATDHKNAEYLIEGQRVKLHDGMAESEVAPGSASKIVTRYFGNEFKTDLNGDNREDVVFLLTQSGGASGTFFYVVAALNTAEGYVGSEGYFLGDRIAPQTTEASQNPQHKNVVVVQYADRAHGEPMTAQPSVGKSVYLKLDPVTMQWGIVEVDFEEKEDEPEPIAESWGTILGTVLLGPTCPVAMDPPDPNCADKPYETRLAITSSDQSRVIKEVTADAEGTFRVDIPPGTYAIRSAAVANILPYCSAEQIVVPINETVEVAVSCDTGIR